MPYEIPLGTIKVLSSLQCECGKSLRKHDITHRGEWVEFICAHCHKTLLELKLEKSEVDAVEEVLDTPYTADLFVEVLQYSKQLADCLEEALDRVLVFSKAEEVLRRFYKKLNTWDCL